MQITLPMNFELNQTQCQQKNNFRFPNLAVTRQVTEMTVYCHGCVLQYITFF